MTVKELRDLLFKLKGDNYIFICGSHKVVKGIREIKHADGGFYYEIIDEDAL